MDGMIVWDQFFLQQQEFMIDMGSLFFNNNEGSEYDRYCDQFFYKIMHKYDRYGIIIFYNNKELIIDHLKLL